MKININEPIDHKWTPEDVVEDYRKYQDKKKVLKIEGDDKCLSEETNASS